MFHKWLFNVIEIAKYTTIQPSFFIAVKLSFKILFRCNMKEYIRIHCQMINVFVVFVIRVFSFLVVLIAIIKTSTMTPMSHTSKSICPAAVFNLSTMACAHTSLLLETVIGTYLVTLIHCKHQILFIGCSSRCSL